MRVSTNESTRECVLNKAIGRKIIGIGLVGDDLLIRLFGDGVEGEYKFSSDTGSSPISVGVDFFRLLSKTIDDIFVVQYNGNDSVVVVSGSITYCLTWMKK